MPKVTVDIPTKDLDELAKKRISELERKLKNAEAREAKLKAKVADYERKEEAYKSLAQSVHSFAEGINEDLSTILNLAFCYECGHNQ